MSYYTYEIASDFRILAPNVEPAFRRAQRDKDVRREIGSDMVDTQTSLADLFEQVGYGVKFDAHGNIEYIWSKDDSHYGLGALLFAIAPFVENDCYIQMTSENQDSWVWYFQDNQCFELDFTVKTLRDKSLKQQVADCIVVRKRMAAERRAKHKSAKKKPHSNKS